MHPRVEEWFAEMEPELFLKFQELRNMILDAHPAMEEKFTYQTPFYHLNGLLFYFAIQKKKKRAVMGFCDGHLLQDDAGILRADEGQAYVRHLVVSDNLPDAEIIFRYILEAVEIKLLKRKK